MGNYNVSNHLSSKIGKVQTLLPVGKSNYNALQVKVDRRYGNGWSVLAAYTYAHSLDNGPAPFDLRSSSAPQNPFDLDQEYATSAADLKHNVTLSNQIELPFGRGKRYLRSAGPLIDALVGGWHLNSIASFHTGTPVNIVSNAGYADYPGLRPDLVPGKNPTLPRAQAHDCGMVQHRCVHQHAGTEQQQPGPRQCGAESRSRPGLHQRRLLAVEECSRLREDELCSFVRRASTCSTLRILAIRMPAATRARLVPSRPRAVRESCSSH